MPPTERDVPSLARRVRNELLPTLHVESTDPTSPVVLHRVPAPWRLLGKGTFAAVFCHPQHPDLAVKVYAPGRPGLDNEVEVYRRLGQHPAYSACLHAEDNFLVLKQLHGTTLYDALTHGRPIPEQVIQDVDAALAYARERGLYPHDVHVRNVMMHDGRGLVADVSDFLKQEDCLRWRDLKRAYYRVYRPFLRPLRLPIPHVVLELIRKGYRLFRRIDLAGS